MTNNGLKLIQSVQRSIDILNCFTKNKPYVSLADISDATGLNINTARGLINTLVANDLLVLDHDAGLYHLGKYFLIKAGIIQEQLRSYILICRPLLNAMAEKFHTTFSLQIVSQNDIVSIYCAYPISSSYYITLSEYTSLPAHVTSSGKLLLLNKLLPDNPAFLDTMEFKQYTPNTIKSKKELLEQLTKIKEDGYSFEKEEFNLGVASVAVPVYDYKGNMIGSVSATTFAKILPTIENDLVEEIKRVVQHITTLLYAGETTQL